VQLLYERNDQGQNSPILAAVGQLQFEVVQYRLKEEYGVVRACVRSCIRACIRAFVRAC
jgi:peptide subunit release factor RF-3